MFKKKWEEKVKSEKLQLPTDLWLGRVVTRPGIPREHEGTHSPDVKAKLTRIRKGGMAGGTRAYYPQIQFTPTNKVPHVEKLGPA